MLAFGKATPVCCAPAKDLCYHTHTGGWSAAHLFRHLSFRCKSRSSILGLGEHAYINFYFGGLGFGLAVRAFSYILSTLFAVFLCIHLQFVIHLGKAGCDIEEPKSVEAHTSAAGIPWHGQRNHKPPLKALQFSRPEDWFLVFKWSLSYVRE